MKLPLLSWKNTIGNLGFKVVKNKSPKQRKNTQREQERSQQQYGTLEPRQMLAGDTGLALQADLSQIFATVQDPLVVRMGQLNNDGPQDAAIISAGGELTIATNGGDDSWQTRQTTDLGVGPVHGMELALVNDDPFQDLIIQGSDGLHVALNDGDGNFSISQTLTPLALGDLASSNGAPLRLATGFFNADTNFDIAAIAPGTDQLVVYTGAGDGTFSGPAVLSTGGSTPTSITSGDFVGNGLPDFALGHADGTVTFIQNEDGTTFTNRADLTVSGFSPVTDVASNDLDSDGDQDIVVSSGDQLTILQNERVEQNSTPVLSNGTFSTGLTDWNTEIVGQPSESVAGSVISQSGFTQLIENESFLVSINQDFVVPASPEKIEVDILSLGLEDPTGGIPDAFEISILDADGNSLVPTFKPTATSFFNVNPGDEISLAPGVTFDGTTVSVDISGIPAGTAATIFFDLVGNGPGNGSTVAFDNVRATPENDLDSSFAPATLTGPFVNVNRVIIDDVDGDQELDIVATDSSNNGGPDKLLVFNGQGDLDFEREEIDLSTSGTGLVSLDSAPLTDGDDVSDLVVLADSGTAISPLSADVTAPQAELVSPIADQTNTGQVSRIDVRFDESMRDLSSTDTGSVTRPENYSILSYGADGVKGTADDTTIAITSVSYNELTGIASLTPDAAAVPLTDGIYEVVLESVNLRDVSDNELNDGDPVSFTFTMNSDGPQIQPVSVITGVEGDIVAVQANFLDAGGALPYNAQINWGDGSITPANMIDFQSGSGTITASHIYADNATYDITITVEDGDGIATQAFTTAAISNSIPTVVTGADITVNQNEAVDQIVASFSDEGFLNINTMTEETFTASINWGDGVTTDGVVSFQTGVPGTPSTGTVEGSHTWAAPGTYQVQITVTDDDGGTATATLEVSVVDTAPVVDPLAEITSDEGAEVTLEGSFSDTTFTDSSGYSAAINWGDGTESIGTVTFDNGTGALNASHTYADNGQYNISVVVSDGTTNSAAETTTATIGNVAPTLVPANTQTIDQGETLSLAAGEFTDPGFDNSTAGTTETFTASVDWGDGSATSAGNVTVTQGQSGVLTSGTIDASHVFTAAGTYTVTLTLTDDDGGVASENFAVTVNSVDTGDGVWLPSINFDNGADGGDLPTGQIITDQWAAWGVQVTTTDPVNHPAMIFDSANPSGGDSDLGSPNASFGGPGVGNGGNNDSLYANSIAQNNILIISEDADSSDPDDNASGGTFVFTFDNPVMLDEIRLLDINNGESAFVRLYDSSGAELSSTPVTGSGGDNGFSVVDLSATGVARMEVELTGSGAITDLIFCRDGHPDGNTTIAGPSNINEGQSYELDLSTTNSSIATWSVDWGDGTVETLSGAATSANHVYADGNDSASVVARSVAANGVVSQSNQIDVTIDNVAPALTISGESTVEAGQEFTLDLDDIDPGTDTISHWVVNWGDGTQPQVVSGDPDSVTHTYATEGQYSVTAQAFDEDSPAVIQDGTLTIRARGSEGVEQFNVLIAGVLVASHTVTTEYQDFVFESDQPINASQVRIQFTNDLWQPDQGIDNNLIVDNIRIGDTIFQTESDDVYSTGTWLPADGIQPGFRNHQWLHANGYFQFGTNFDPADFTPYVSNTISVDATGPSTPDSLWLPTIDFERAASQSALSSGDVITEQFASLGVHVTTDDPTNHPAMIFDSANPTGGDSDLGTPNSAFGGPGIGNGGSSSNDIARGNVLIISEDANSSNPDDNFNGGTLIFTFDNPVMLDEIGLLDIDNNEATFRLYDANGNLIQSQGVTGGGNNSYQTVALDALGVARLEVEFTGSGAITDLVFCRDGHVIEPPPTKFFTVDGQNDTGFEYSASGEQLEQFDLVDGAVSRGVTTTASGNPVWVVKSNEWVYVYDRANDSYLGKWDAAGPEWARGIATDGDDIWIVDAKYDRVYQYNGGADWTGGWHASSSSFKLHSNNYNPSGLAFSGDKLYVTDAGSDRVFVYSTSGQHEGNWALDWRNKRSSGITSDVSGQHLWVTDYDDGEIYYYENATSRRGGYQAADHLIALAANNQRPEGIADPAVPINLGEVVNGTIANAGEIFEYAFTGTAGQEIFADEITGNFRFGWALTSPNGDSLFRSVFFEDSGRITLPQDGDYTLTVGTLNNTNLGDFSFQIFDVPAPTTETIDITEVVSGEILVPGQERDFVFTGTAGQEVFAAEISGNFRIGWALVAPNGDDVFRQRFFQDSGTITLPQDGDYILTVGSPSNSTLGEFSFQITDVPATTTEAINLDEVVTGDILVPGQERDFTFAGTAGQRIFSDQISGNLRFTWSLESPSGTTLYSQNFLDRGVVELPEDGQYTLNVGSPNTSTTGAFSFELIDVPSVSPQSINVGEVVSGQRTVPGQEQAYTFTATAGQDLFFDSQSGSLAIRWRLLDSSGVEVFNRNFQDTRPATIALDGQYTLIVGSANIATTSDFTFQIWDVPQTVAQPIDFNTPTGDSVLIPSLARRYTFEGTTDQSVFVDFTVAGRPGTPTSSATNPAFDFVITGPNGEEIVDSTIRDHGLLVLPADGQYTIDISARNISTTLDSLAEYEFTLYDSSPAGPISIDQATVVSDTTNPQQEITYQFSANSGQNLVFDVQKNVEDDVTFEIISPSGEVVVPLTRSDASIGPVTESGIYTVSVATDAVSNSGIPDADGRGEFAFRIQDVPVPVSTGQRDSAGTEFWVAFTPANTFQTPLPQDLSIRVSSEIDTVAVVTIPEIGFIAAVDVVAGEVTNVAIPLDSVISGDLEDEISNQGVHVVSEDPVTLQVVQDGGFSSDGYLAHPVDALGNDFVVLDYYGFQSFGTGEAQFIIVGVEDNTDVTIVPSVTSGARTAGVPYTITLNQGQTYRLSVSPGSAVPGRDLTGTTISSTNPVSVLSGSTASFVPGRVSSADMLVEQLPSTDTWGSSFYTIPFATRTGGDTFRFLAATDNTFVSVNGQNVAQLNRGEHFETIIDGPSEITSSQPILVGQYANSNNFDGIQGDPSFLIVDSFEQARNEYSFATGISGIEQHYANIVIGQQNASTLLLDGQPIDPALLIPIANTGFVGTQLPVGDGSHRLTADGPFTAISYGFGTDDSYAYSVGTGLARISEAASLALTPETATLSPGQTQTVKALVLDTEGQPVASARVDFSVVGVNAQTGFAYTDDAGNASFTWNGDNAGADAVTAFVGSLFDSSSVNWETVSPSVTISTPDPAGTYRPGQSVSISGVATPGAVDADIVSVTVNGQPVSALDSAGNYFALINATSGPQTFDVIATDRFGNTATDSVTIAGTEFDNSDASQFSRVADSEGEFTFSRTTFNRSTDQLWFHYAVTATGTTSLQQGTQAVFSQFAPSAVFPDPDSGTTTTLGQTDVFLQPVNIPAGGLAVGQTTDHTHLKLNNLDRQRFDFDASLLAPQNTAPVFESAPNTIAIVGQPYTYSAVANDIDSDTIEYSLASGPDTMSIDAATGIISWTPAANDVANHSVEIIADDGNGGVATQSFVLTAVPAAPANRAPLFVSQPDSTFNLGTVAGASGTWEYQAIALDPENDSLTFAVTTAPAGVTVDAASGLVQWNVDGNDLGQHPITIEATDTAGNVTPQSFNLNIVAVETADVSGVVFEDTNGDTVRQAGETGLAGRTIYLDTNSNGQLDAGETSQTTAGDGSYTFSGLLAGSYAISQVRQTGFDVTAPGNGVANVSLTAGLSLDDLNFANSINGVTGQSAPEITSSPELFAKVANLYSYQITATDADGDNLSFSLLNGPDGMTVDPGTGLVSWLPTAEQQIRTDVLVQVDDGNGNVDVQAFNLFVKPQFEAPAFITTPERFATLDEAFAYDADVIDGDDLESIVFDLAAGPNGATIDPTTGEISWTPDALSQDVQFTVTATDGAGLVASQSFLLDVRDTNTAPVFTTQPVTEITAGANYAYDANATDAQDSVTYSLVTPVDGVSINQRTGTVTILGATEAVDYTIRATDDRGLFTDQDVNVALVADTEAPTVAINASDEAIGASPDLLQVDEQGTPTLSVDQTVEIQLYATDNVAVTSLSVTVDGVSVQLTPRNTFLYTATQPGIPVIIATATDEAGNVGTTTQRLRVIDPTDDIAPAASIDSPKIGDAVTYLTDITATVTSDGDIFNWTVDFSPVGLNQWTVLATGDTDIDGQIVAQFDPTLLANGGYDIRITAVDFSGNSFTIAETISVESQAKIGNYATSFTDLQIPLAGIPISIIRQYDTLNTAISGDFGHGWRLSFGDANIQESIPVGQAELDGGSTFFGASDPLFIGAKVFITTPEGQRVAFTFDPIAEPTLLGTSFIPRFTAVDTDYTLEVPEARLSQRADGTFGYYLIDFPYNPRDYTLVSQDQIRYEYDQFDGLQTISDRNNTTLEYRDDGIFSSTGESIQFVRDDRSRITEIIDPSGNSINYTYSAAGDLITYTDQVDNTWTHDYFSDPAHYLERITGPRGNVLQEVKYDDDGRFVGLVDALGNETKQEYDIENNTFVQTDRNGNPTTLEFDDRGNITVETDALGGETLYEYADPDNPRLETAITDANGNTTRFEYDLRGNVTLQEEPGGIFTQFQYDSFNNVTRIVGPATSDPGDGYADTLIDSFFADGVILGTTVGQRLADAEQGIELSGTEIDSPDIVLGAEFDRDRETEQDSDYLLLKDGDYVTVGFNERVTDREGDDLFIVTPLFSGEFVSSGARALVSVTTDGTNYVSVGEIEGAAIVGIDLADSGIVGDVLGVRITGQFTDDGNPLNDRFGLTAVQTALGTDFRTTRFVYDDNGNLAETIDALGNSSFQTNDNFGRPLTITDRRGNTTTFEYDQFIGSPTRVINPDNSTQEFTYDNNGRLLTQTNELGIVVQAITYDDLGRQLTVSGADGQLTTYVYDNDLLVSETVTINATEVQTTTYEYDDNNRLFKQTDANGGVVELTYDAQGNTTSLTDPVGNTTSYVFDALNRQTQETDPLNQITTYNFDAVGNLTEQVDRLGRRIEFQYDERDRQTAELWYAVDGTLIETSTYTYDIFSNLLTADDAESSYAYTYDVLDRLITSDNAGTPDAPNVILTYGYDVDGNRTSVADNSGVTIDSEYGSRNELLSKTWFGGEVDDARVEYDYDDALRETSVERFSDTDGTNLIGQIENVYDNTGRRIRITHLDGSDVVLANYEYEFDQANRITQQIIDGDTVDYGYDLTGQLLSADHSDPSIPDEFYVYDLNGNRIESHLHGSDYVTGPNNQLLSDGEFNYEYDAEGNQVRRTNIATGEVTEFEYDHRNRQTKTTVKTSGGIITSESQYVFDVFGRRIAIINDADGAGSGEAVRTNIVYDGDNAWADYNEAGEAIARYLFGDGIDSNVARWQVGQGTAWYLTDHLGTVRGVADAVGILVNQTTYDSFGQVLNETNSLLGDRFKFTGRELNSGSDYFYRARTYNAIQGRFGSLDPVGFRGEDTSLFRYAENSPVNFADPSGRVVENATLRTRFTAFVNTVARLGIDLLCIFVRAVAFFPVGAIGIVGPLSIPFRTLCGIAGR